MSSSCCRPQGRSGSRPAFYRKAEALEHREREACGTQSRICVGLIESGCNHGRLIEDQTMGQLQHVSVSEVRSDQVLAGAKRRRRHDAGRYKVCLSLEVHIELEIQFLLWILDHRVTRTSSV